MQVKTENLRGCVDPESTKAFAEEKKSKSTLIKLRASASQIAQMEHAQLTAIVECSEDAIVSKTLDGTILTWNKAAERILGYLAKDAIGRSIHMLIPADRQDEEMTILRNLRETGERVEDLVTVRLAQDGSRLNVIISICPVRDRAGKVVGASKTLRKITEQRAAILDGEARLRGVVETISEAILTITELGIIESVNSGAVTTFGYSREELVGQHVKLLMPDPFFTEDDGYQPNFRDTGEQKIIGAGRELMGKRKDGTTFPVDLALSEVQLINRKLFTCIAEDSTQRKNAERSITAVGETSERAETAKEQFLSRLSHELRTPLTPALAEISFLEQDNELSPELRIRLKMVRRNIETEARLVDDLLDMSSITHGKIQLHYEVVDLHEVVRSILLMLQPATDAKSLEISESLRAQQHHVWADPGRIQQILLNLVSNAVKFTPANGRIWVHSTNDLAGMIQVEIGDNGVGIDPETLPRIFNSFEQSGRTRRLGGLGLGLSIARSLTELHLGNLTGISLGQDHGSSFTLALPSAPPTTRVPSVPRSSETPKISHRILLVEDHDDTRAVFARLLTNLGCTVTVAASVREALEEGEKGTFDLLISDVGLPDGSGHDVMKRLKPKLKRGIALSGFGQPEDVRRSQDAGFDLHLTKPLNFNMLKDMLQQMT